MTTRFPPFLALQRSIRNSFQNAQFDSILEKTLRVSLSNLNSFDYIPTIEYQHLLISRISAQKLTEKNKSEISTSGFQNSLKTRLPIINFCLTYFYNIYNKTIEQLGEISNI